MLDITPLGISTENLKEFLVDQGSKEGKKFLKFRFPKYLWDGNIDFETLKKNYLGIEIEAIYSGNAINHNEYSLESVTPRLVAYYVTIFEK